MPTPPILRAAAAFVHGLIRSRLSMPAVNLVTDHESLTFARRAAMGFLHLTCPSSYFCSSANTVRPEDCIAQ